MRNALVAAALALAAGSSFADMIATNGQGDEIRLFESACTNQAILDLLKPEYRTQFKRGQAFIEGKTHSLCWIDTGEGVYWIAFENGQGLPLPVTSFISSPGV